MRIEHVAIWTNDVERLRDFYVRWFEATASPRYENPTTGFASYFLSFGAGARLELMQREGVAGAPEAPTLGYAHLALSLGSEILVDQATAKLGDAGFAVVDGPRRTGDGYYESVILDPDGNRVELTS